MRNKQSPIPIYHQIEETIKASIENGELKSGDVLPSENDYTAIFQVSRMTVRQAINNLVNAGYLYRLKGKGTYVSDRKIEQTLEGLTSFTEDMRSRGLAPGIKLLKFGLIPSPISVAKILKLKEHDPIYEIKRIRLANQIPMAYETTYIPANLVKGLTEGIVNQSLYDYIENQLGLKISKANQIIEASIVKKEEQGYLELPTGAPVLVMERRSFLQNEQPLELVKSIYRADRYKFFINMKR